jgi:3-phenylpropionate/trans-cinnamate dioxygenase ferredoxin reductase component
MDRTVAIVGAGQAGGGCALALRKKGFKGRILLFGAENEAPYERPSLSKEYLSGESAVLTYLAKPQRWIDDDIDLKTGTMVTGIDRLQKTVTTDVAQKSFSYDYLVLATGGEPRHLPVLSHERICYLRSAADSMRIAALAEEGRTALIVGAGVIGLEVAATLRKGKMNVVVVEAGDAVMSRVVSSEVGHWIEALHARHGTELLKSTSIAGMRASDDGVDVELSDGRQISAKFVVVGIGISLNDDLARKSSLECGDGVIVDAQFRSVTDQSIYAIGDLACVSGSRRDETWTNAQTSAEAAASSIVDGKCDTPSVPYFWSTQYGCTLQVVGRTSKQLRTLAIGDCGLLYIDDSERATGLVMLDGKRDFQLGRRLVVAQAQLARTVIESGVLDIKRASAKEGQL